MPPALTPEHLDAVLGAEGCLSAALAGGEDVALRIAGECMVPDLADGETVRLTLTRVLFPGDVVAFRCSTQDRLLVHRFLGYVRHRGSWKLMTMADRGSRPDPLVDPARFIGRVKLRGERHYRISPVRRLAALGRFVAWCCRLLRRRLVRRAGVGR